MNKEQFENIMHDLAKDNYSSNPKHFTLKCMERAYNLDRSPIEKGKLKTTEEIWRANCEEYEGSIMMSKSSFFDALNEYANQFKGSSSTEYNQLIENAAEFQKRIDELENVLSNVAVELGREINRIKSKK